MESEGASGWLVTFKWFRKVLCTVVAMSCVSLRALQNKFLKKKVSKQSRLWWLSCTDVVRLVFGADGTVQERGLGLP